MSGEDGSDEIAASLLRSSGRAGVTDLVGRSAAWRDESLPVTA